MARTWFISAKTNRYKKLRLIYPTKEKTYFKKFIIVKNFFFVITTPGRKVEFFNVIIAFLFINISLFIGQFLYIFHIYINLMYIQLNSYIND
jgi:hypothetical protein